MREHLQRLEKSHHSWFLIGILFLFFVLRLPSLFEPYWYGDEGIYETIGLALSKGRTLYTQIWDNKPPLLYVTYALVQGNQFAVRLLSLLAGIGAVIIFYLLSERLFRTHKAPIVATVIFMLLFGLPMFEGNIANAENFMLLFILAAAYLITSLKRDALNSRTLLIAGILLGIAFLYKIVGIFDFAAFFLFIVLSQLPKSLTWQTFHQSLQKEAHGLLNFIGGFLAPFVIVSLYFLVIGAFPAFIHATFLSTVGYVGYNNAFIIPQGLLISKLLVLGIYVIILFLNRARFSKSALFILLWIAFSLFNSFFSQRPYTHYVLVLIPSFALLVGSIGELSIKLRRVAALISLIIAITILNYFNHWSLTKTVRYYANFVSYLNGSKSLAAYQAFFDKRATRDSEIASYINSHGDDTKTMYLWGNSAQLYYLTNTLPAGRFTVAYHVAGNKAYMEETTQAVKKERSQFIVVMKDSQPVLFPLDNYQHKLTIEGADIYERID